MDGSRFDSLTRSLAQAPSRRTLIRGALGAVAGALGFAGKAEARPPVNCPAGHLCNGECCAPGLEACCAGKCVEIPGQNSVPPQARVRTYPVVEKFRWVWIWMGDPAKADPGTIRKEFATNIERNAIHGSDGPETAAFEISYFFSQLELVG